jgi:putative heme-binding domain-containing protein
LLISILDPNRAIDGSYVAYTVLTVAGKTYSGILSDETASTVALVMEEGQSIPIPREDIDQLIPSSSSFMPIGMEREINQQQMADLLAYLKNWRFEETSD